MVAFIFLHSFEGDFLMKINAYEEEKFLEIVELPDEPRVMQLGKGCVLFVVLLMGTAPLIFLLAPSNNSFDTFMYIFFTLWYGILGFIVYMTLYGKPKSLPLKSLIIDKENSLFSIELKKNSKKSILQKIAFHDIDSFKLEFMGALSEKEDIMMTMFLRYESSNIGMSYLESTFTVRDIDTKNEVLDFGERIAKIIGLPKHEIERNDHMGFTFVFFRSEFERGEKYTKETQNILSISSPLVINVIKTDGKQSQNAWDNDHATSFNNEENRTKNKLESIYAKDDVKQEEALEEIISRPWDPDEDPIDANIIENNLPARLVYERVGHWKGVLITLVIATAIFLLFSKNGLPFKYMTSFQNMLNHLSPAFALYVFFLIFMSVLILSGSIRLKTERWTWDFVEGQVRQSESGKTKIYYFSNIKEIILELHKVYHSSKNSSGTSNSYYTYHCEVFIKDLKYGRIQVAQTGSVREDPDQAYQYGIAFGNMLAKTADITLNYEDKS